ncbi:hypothetical protein [Bradyrhizobium sp. JR3.5]
MSPPIRQAGPAAMTRIRVRRVAGPPDRLAEDQNPTFIYDGLERGALIFAWMF